MGFKRMQHLTHDMENVFQEVRNDKIKVNGDIIDILFQCLDAIEGYLNNYCGFKRYFKRNCSAGAKERKTG